MEAAVDFHPLDLHFPLKDGSAKQQPCHFWIFFVEFCTRFAQLGGMSRSEYRNSVVKAVVEKWVVHVGRRHKHAVQFLNRGTPISKQTAVLRLQKKVQQFTDGSRSTSPVLVEAFAHLGKRESPSVDSTAFLSVDEIADRVAAEVMDLEIFNSHNGGKNDPLTW